MTTNSKDEKLNNSTCVQSTCSHSTYSQNTYSYARSLIEAGLDPLVTISRGGKITDVNEATAQVTGIPREKLIGTDFSDYFTEPEKAREVYKEVFEKGFVKNYPLAIRHVSGKITYVIYNATIYKDETGTIQGVFATARDITERKKVEDALRESEEEFRCLFEYSTVGKSITYTSGKIHVNNAFCKILGYSKEELENLKWKDIAHPDDMKSSKEAIKSIVTGKNESVRFEKRCFHKDGHTVWLDASISLYRDKENKPIYFMTDMFDNTERRKTEEIIKAERQRFNDIMDRLPVYLVLLTQDYRIAFANNFFRERFGESNGKKCFEYLFDRSEPCKACEAYTVLKTGEPYHWEWKGPDNRNYDIFDLPFTDTDGSKLILEMGIDITDRKKAEADLHKVNEELIHSNKDFEQFAYCVSHDLQEPLRAVYSFAEFLEADYGNKFDTKAEEYIEFITSAAKRMQQMINDILILSRVGTRGKEFLPINIENVIKIVTENLRGFIDEHNAMITYDAQMPTILADKTQLTQLFQNLIENGIKFHKKDESPKINVSFQEDNNEYLFSVQDNGIGVEEKYFKKLFIIFQRLHDREEYPGTGIGLAMCKKIVERHGGRIWLESKVGHGSTFYFTIPKQPGQYNQ